MDDIEELKQIIFKKGNFKLKNGSTSSVYFDFRSVISYPTLLNKIAFRINDSLINKNIVLTGIPFGGLPFAMATASLFELPMIAIRDPKKYGTKKTIEGKLITNNCVVIDDVITTGGSIIESINILLRNNIRVVQIIVLLARDDTGVAKIKKLFPNIPMTILFDKHHFNHNFQCSDDYSKRYFIQKFRSVIQAKKSNLIFSADLTNPIQLLQVLDKIGAYICGVKLHTDIIDFSNMPQNIFDEKINELKRRDIFLVIEDRKFADIGKIMVKQLDRFLHRTDIVTAYGTTGFDSLKMLNDKNVGILLIAQLSSTNNLLDTKYLCEIKEMAMRLDNVCGFICQEKIIDQFINCSPGVHLNKKVTDGQYYSTPESRISNCIDVIIVGRGIYDSQDMIEQCKKYNYFSQV